MALEADWKDDLDVTRVIQTPKMQSFTNQPDIPLEAFNPCRHPFLPESRERKVNCLTFLNIPEKTITNSCFLGKIGQGSCLFLFFHGGFKLLENQPVHYLAVLYLSFAAENSSHLITR